MSLEPMSRVLNEIMNLCEDAHARYTWAARKASRADLTVLFGTFAAQRALDTTTLRQLRAQYLDCMQLAAEFGSSDVDTFQDNALQLDSTTSTRHEQLLAICIEGEERISAYCVAARGLNLPTALCIHIEQQHEKATSALNTLRLQQSQFAFSVGAEKEQPVKVAAAS